MRWQCGRSDWAFKNFIILSFAPSFVHLRNFCECAMFSFKYLKGRLLCIKEVYSPSMLALRRAVRPLSAAVQRRNLSVHEYVSKGLLREFGCATEFGTVATTLDEVKAACNQIKTTKKVVKSQILAGGRGLGHFKNGFKSGVHLCNGTDEAMRVAKEMLGNTLITKQTGEKGLVVSKLYVTECIENKKRELYVALILDRAKVAPTFIASAEGGTSIEQLAKERPDCIKKMPINIRTGIDAEAAKQFALSLGFAPSSVPDFTRQLTGMYNLAKAKDATMVEINPLVELNDGKTLCIDAKVSFDDNAKFRRPEIWQFEDLSQKDSKEVEAGKWDLNYIALDGNVGCMVNGAGLAMATMDVISLYGATPANFLDVGGSAATNQIVKAFEIISSDPKVKCLLVNIFGGIMKCDLIAAGIVEAVHVLKGKLNLPLVVRLEGTNEEQGRRILRESGLKIHPVANLDEAGRTAAAFVKSL